MIFGLKKDNFVNLVSLRSAGIDPTTPHVLKLWRKTFTKITETAVTSYDFVSQELPEETKYVKYLQFWAFFVTIRSK